MANSYSGNRIIVIGCPGSGKSTLAIRLHERTALPVVHLDNIWWKADRTHITQEEFDQKLAEALYKDRWIIDGDYSRTYEMRFHCCDTVIFLDYSKETCMSGITARVGKQRPDIPWTESALDTELVKLVQSYRQENRPQILRLMEKYPQKQYFVFHTREEADIWLESL
ncbi:MAG: adenylate kinase [Clostridia bacterium]|nr:adenylate kinase [Clostridia bacterium]